MEYVIDITPPIPSEEKREGVVSVIEMQHAMMIKSQDYYSLNFLTEKNSDGFTREYSFNPYELPKGSTIILERDGQNVGIVDADLLRSYNDSGVTFLLQYYAEYLLNNAAQKTFDTFAEGIATSVRKSNALIFAKPLELEKKEVRFNATSYDLGA